MKFGWVVGLVALVAAGFASVATPERAATARQAPPAVAAEASRIPVALPQRRMPGKARADLFAARDWTPRAPPAPVQAAPEPAAAPSAPPNPYRFAGTVHYDGSLKAVFIREQKIHIARPGETLDGGYKVLSVARDAVTLLFTALDIEQQLALAQDPAPDTVAAQPSQNGTPSSPVAPGSPLAVR
ncbi:MAG TPA: hypothetical protein VH600_02330 [Burkholderiales bacterium]|jgi:hypothetical protein